MIQIYVHTNIFMYKQPFGPSMAVVRTVYKTEQCTAMKTVS